MSFAHAVETTRKDKTQIKEDPKGEFFVTVNEENIIIRDFIFYKFEDILASDTEPVTIRIATNEIKTCPTIKIPVPIIRRKVAYDNKFFFSEIKKQYTYSQGNSRSGTLYIPFLYCYFEETFHEESNGYIIRVFPKYSSKIDRNLTFIDFNNFTEREDEELKSKAIELWIEMNSLYLKARSLEEEFDAIDSYGKLREEFRVMSNKLVQRGDD